MGLIKYYVGALNKIIVKTAINSLAVIFILFGYGISMFALAFPQPMVNLCDTLGAKGASAMYTERIYLRDKTAQKLYLMLDKYIAAKNDSKIIKYIPTLLAHSEYRSVIKAVNEYKSDRTDDFMTLAHACNEDNRLRLHYVSALLRKGRTAAAIDAFSDAVDTSQFKFTDSEDTHFFLSSPSYVYFLLAENNLANERTTPLFQGYYDRFNEIYRDWLDENHGEIPSAAAEYFVEEVRNWL